MKVNPIKDIEKVEEMKRELERCDTKGIADRRFFERKRNRALFCTGINTALRVSDLTSLDLIDIFKEDLTFRTTVGATEQKTKKYKEFAINDKLKEELTNYICCYFYALYGLGVGIDSINLEKLNDQEREQVKEIVKTKPLFPSERTTEHISRYQVDRILKSAGERCGLENIGTHTMRKTFGYWFYRRTKDIATLQKMLNHSSQRETMIYIGLEQEEINNAYLNFGL